MKTIKNIVFVLLLISNSLLLSTCDVFEDILTNISSKEPNNDIGIRIKSINFSGNWYFNNLWEENQLEIMCFSWMDVFPLYFDVVYTPDKTDPYNVFTASISNLNSSKMYYYRGALELSTENFESSFKKVGGTRSRVINSTPKTVFKKGTNNDLIFNYDEQDMFFPDIIGEIIINNGKPMFYLVDR